MGERKQKAKRAAARTWAIGSIAVEANGQACFVWTGTRDDAVKLQNALAIAAGLAKGLLLSEAVREAKVYVSTAIAAADRLNVGSGSGPLHHFHRWW